MEIFSAHEAQMLRASFTNSKPPAAAFPPKVLELIYEKRLFKLYVPNELGGKECTFREALDCFIQAASIDGDFGWAIQIGSGGGIFSGYVQPRIAERYFTNPQFVIAGSGYPTAKAKVEEDGYRINGFWKYCSGSEYATLITGNCETPDGVIAVALLPDQVGIDKDWDAYGMSNTASHKVTVHDKLIPFEYTFQVNKIVADFGYQMFYVPFPVYAKANVFATVLGCFQHLLEELKALPSDKTTSPNRKADLVKLWEELSPAYSAYKHTFLSNADYCWDVLTREGKLTDQAQDKMDTTINEALVFIKNAAYRIFLQAGLAATHSSHPLNKVWRDITTAFQHAILK